MYVAKKRTMFIKIRGDEEVIVRITFSDRLVVLFGNSYKDWSEQASEFLRIYPELKIEKIESSESKWIDWGGLKWCSEKNFQAELNREGCQDADLDNPNPRKYIDMIFVDAKPLIKRLEEMRK